MKSSFFLNLAKNMFFYILSAFLLSLSFPRIDFCWFAWIALVPLMFILDGKSRGESFRLGYSCGVFFFGLTIYWFMFVTTLGGILAVLYLALYLGLFGLGYGWLSSRKLAERVFLIPALWVALEYVRAHALSGFGWASLGYSQYQNLWIVQIADCVGVYGVSFLIVMVNVLCKEMLICIVERPAKVSAKEILPVLVIVAVLIAGSVGYGAYRLGEPSQGIKINIGVVQGNVPHERRWSPKAWPFILRDYFKLSEKLVAQKADLIVWPESAYPGYYGEDPELAQELDDFLQRTKTPHLIGMITKQQEDYFNSAVLFCPLSKTAKEYSKIHLVPFGEFIPFREQLPFLAQIIPIDDFTRGKEYVLFEPFLSRAQGQKVHYSALICFEDTVPELVRGFVNNGSGLLVNISNDAWFGDSREPFLHLQSSVFRSIENRRYLVRCGNVGVSCFIDPWGRIVKKVADERGKSTYVEGVALAQAEFMDVKTLYTKFGDFFAYFCISAILVYIILPLTKPRKKRELA